MKVEFELNLDANGSPCIKFRHYDKSNSLEQKLLKSFIDAVKSNGIILSNVSGYVDTSGVSFDNYEIRIKND